VVDSVSGLTTSSDAGATVLTAASPITFAVNTTATSITATATESGTTNFDNITVNAGVTVTATAGNITFRAGDRIIINATATVQATASTGNVTLESGFGDSDNDGSQTLDGTISAGGSGVVTLNLNAQQGATQAST